MYANFSNVKQKSAFWYTFLVLRDSLLCMEINVTRFWYYFDTLLLESKYTNLKQLCAEANCRYRTITQQRTRKTLPDIVDICKFAKAFGVSLDNLVYGNDRKTSIDDAVYKKLFDDPQKKRILMLLANAEDSILGPVETLLASQQKTDIPSAQSAGI
jgi:transcriptional regulator with XRE-family HTH domain